MNGVLVVDKPSGPTSHDVVAAVRRAIGQKRVGHTGTLDPLATGVLPLVLGQATRLASLLSATDKEYVADIRFGAATPTFDADGRIALDPVTGRMETPVAPPDEPAGLSAEAIERVLPQFRGTFLQEPPAFSAKKSEGVRAYEKARRNEAPLLKPVRVTVAALVLEDYTRGRARIRLRSSAGFYVRSFAHNLGGRMGCGAYLEGLRRTAAAGFSLADAVSLDRVVREPADALTEVVPLGRLLPDLPAVVLNEKGVKRTAHGNTLSRDDYEFGPAADLSVENIRELPPGASPVRLIDRSGALLGIATRLGNGLLHPAIVLV
jgi:tRNA pseudouridine55 synthase